MHAFTYAKTFANASGGGAAAGEEGGADVALHQCLLPIEQFWTVNYWHWVTDALPKALLLRTLRETHPAATHGCKILAYPFPWTRQYLAAAADAADAVYYSPRRLDYACRVLLPSPSALDGANLPLLDALRAAVLPRAAPQAVAAAASAGVGTSRGLVLLQMRKAEKDSVHGAGRVLTNLDALVAAVSRLFGDDLEVLLFDHQRHSALEQAALYSRARVVIGVHGAGFANILWAPAGCEIVEIVPIDVHLDFQCGLTPFWHVASLLGQRKHAFVAFSGRMFEPFELPVLEFVAFLRASGVGAGATA